MTHHRSCAVYQAPCLVMERLFWANMDLVYMVFCSLISSKKIITPTYIKDNCGHCCKANLWSSYQQCWYKVVFVIHTQDYGTPSALRASWPPIVYMIKSKHISQVYVSLHDLALNSRLSCKPLHPISLPPLTQLTYPMTKLFFTSCHSGSNSVPPFFHIVSGAKLSSQNAIHSDSLLSHQTPFKGPFPLPRCN